MLSLEGVSRFGKMVLSSASSMSRRAPHWTDLELA